MTPTPRRIEKTDHEYPRVERDLQVLGQSATSHDPAPSIPLFVPRFQIDECLTAIRECLERGWTGLGFKTVEFENAWKRYSGLLHPHFLNSNTAGLHLALHILKTRYGWTDGDQVITTPLTFVSTNHAILYCGLHPVFADVDEYLCLDPSSVAARITPKTRALMFVGIGGNAGQYDSIVELCREHNFEAYPGRGAHGGNAP